MPVVERVLPHNLEAEKSVLGALLVDPRAFMVAAAIVKAEDFFREAHGRIFRSMQRLSEAGVPIDVLTLRDDLVRVGDLQEVGGPAYVSGLADGVPRSTNVEYYAKIVLEKATLRATIDAANKILSHAYAGELDASMIVDDGVQRLLSLTSGPDQTVTTIGAAMKTWMDTFDGSVPQGFSTGLTDLDELLIGGLHQKELVMIAGRPSMGKSTLMMNIAENVAHAGTPAAVFTLEMSPTALVEGSLARAARIDAHRLRAKVLTEKDYADLSHAMEVVHGLPLYLIPHASTLTQIQSWARRLYEQSGVRVFAVDYIQRMGDPNTRDRRLEIDRISRSFQRLAHDMDSVMIVLSQLTRASEQRTDKRPLPSDLKESGALEADADTIILIYRDDVYNKDPNNENAGTAELIVAKQRHGPTGVARVTFLKEQLRFANLAYR